MQSPCLKKVTQVCLHGCCPSPLLGLPELQHNTTSPKTARTSSACRKNFTSTTATSFFPNTVFTDHESLPSLKESQAKFTKTYPQYTETARIDRIRAQEYYHLSLTNRTCLDYIGIGLFSHLQLQTLQHSSDFPFFSTTYKSVNLKTQLLQGGHGSGLERSIKERITSFLNISETDYCMVLTSNKSSAFKIVAESYPFHSSRKLLPVYDYESEAVDAMVSSAEKRGAKIMPAEFKWPGLRIHSAKLRKAIVKRGTQKTKRTRGLFVFPLQSQMTGSSYSYQWMSLAQENGWHVLFDACALGPKDMDSFGLSLIQPDFIICPFYKVFGENPTGFGCLFVKKSVVTVLESTVSVGIINILPPKDYSSTAVQLLLDEEDASTSKVEASEIETIECRGLDQVDSLGLIQTSMRTRCLINWLINALAKLHHPNTETSSPLIRIYGPKVKFDRGPALAFNVYDWKGEKVEPVLVQKLADRNNISLGHGFLHRMWFSDKYGEDKERVMEFKKKCDEEGELCTNGGSKRHYKGEIGVGVVTAAIGFLATFEDVYKLWVFVARFLDADFVEKERWRYTSLNQKMIEI